MFRSLLKNNILRAYGTSLLGVFSGLLTNLWLLREITLVVPAHDFGIYAFVVQISAYLAILQLGLDFAASRQIAECLGRHDLPAANRAFSDLWRFNLRIVWLGLPVVLGIAALFWFGIGLKGPADLHTAHLAGEIALVAGASQLVSFVARPFSAALIGSQIQATVNIVAVLRTVTTTFLAFGLLKSGCYILSVPIAEVFTQCLAFLVLRGVVHRNCRWREAAVETTAGSKRLSPMFKYGWLTSLGGVAWTIEAGMDVVILGYFTDAKTVAAYALWWRFPQMIFSLCSRLADSAFPRFSHSFGSSPEAARAIFTKVTYLTLGLATLALVGISFWLHPFVDLWIGAAYVGAQNAYLPLGMGLLVCLRACGNLLGMFWLASGRAEFTTVLAWIQAALKIALAVWLVPRWGIMGIVAASCGSSLLQVVAMAIHLRGRDLLKAGLGVRALAFLAIAAVAASMSSRCSFAFGWTGLLAGAAATSLIWAGLWALMAATGELRKPLTSLFMDAAKRFALIKVG